MFKTCLAFELNEHEGLTVIEWFGGPPHPLPPFPLDGVTHREVGTVHGRVQRTAVAKSTQSPTQDPVDTPVPPKVRHPRG